MIKEQRSEVRVTPKNMTADIGNGFSAFQDCPVHDISNSGLAISCNNNLISKDGLNSCDIVIIIDSKPVKLKCQPRWFQQNRGIVSIGFEITKNVGKWRSMISSMIPKLTPDVWGLHGMKHLQ